MKALHRVLLSVVLTPVTIVATAVTVHCCLPAWTRLAPPVISIARRDTLRQVSPQLRWYGASYVHVSQDLIEARLAGSPVEIGLALGTLLRNESIETERRLYDKFSHYVRSPIARTLLLDWARIRYARLDQTFDPELRQEIAGVTQAIQPDPFATFMATYQRQVFLNGLYDVSLSFEHSPLVGCTTFLVRHGAAAMGHSLLARNFDFEVDAVFDKKKTVYLILEDGRLPYLSVAWPGMPGAVSAMNAQGVAVVAHGGRAGSLDVTGQPVLQTLRYVMGHARSTREAVAILEDRKPMVSHIVIVTDGTGDSKVVERVPKHSAYTYSVPERAVVTNHFSGPSAADPRNVRVRKTTSTVDRMHRGEELLAQLQGPTSPEDLIPLLRDRNALGGTPLPLGDRRAISALIAAHGVVFDTTARKAWISAAPHLLGRFVELDVTRLLANPIDPEALAASRHYVAADELLASGDYAEWSRRNPGHGD